MIAEIYGKLSGTGSNLHDRLEDNLTGEVFGSLRYIQFNSAMKKILVNCIYPKSLSEHINKIKADFWNENIKFWPYDEEGEIDALMEFEDVIIGIEVKYKSGLSSDDNMDFSELIEEELSEYEQNNSIHQLARESRIISKKGDKKKKILIFIASSSSCREVYEDTIRRDLVEEDVELGYITWQAFLNELSKLDLKDKFQNLIIEDLKKLLKRKGFEQYKDMDLGDEFEINPSSYFRFDYVLKTTIDFDVDIDVRGDLYYEFKRKY